VHKCTHVFVVYPGICQFWSSWENYASESILVYHVTCESLWTKEQVKWEWYCVVPVSVSNSRWVGVLHLDEAIVLCIVLCCVIVSKTFDYQYGFLVFCSVFCHLGHSNFSCFYCFKTLDWRSIKTQKESQAWWLSFQIQLLRRWRSGDLQFESSLSNTLGIPHLNK
jgi:hypothetical protein